jgi:hypothetical protein
MATLTPQSENYKKSFFQSGVGMALTGGIGALIGMGQRHAQKLKMAKAGQMDALGKLGAMEMAPESQVAYQQSQQMANQGMDAASRQLAIQESARGQNANISALRSKRSLLAGAPGLNVSSNDFALRLAAQDAMTRRENKMSAIQTGMQFGGQKTALDQYKNEQFLNYYLGKQASANSALTGALNAVGSLAGATMGAAGNAGGFKALFKGK